MVSLDTGFLLAAASEGEAIEEAERRIIESIQDGTAEFQIESIFTILEGGGAMASGQIEYTVEEASLPGLPDEMQTVVIEFGYEIQKAEPENGLHGDDAEITGAFCISATFRRGEQEEEWEPGGLAGELLGHLIGERFAEEVNGHGACSESVKWDCVQDWRNGD